VRVEIHVFGGGGRSFFAEVDEVGFAGRGAKEEKSSAADVAGLGMDDGEGKSGGDGGVNGIASRLHHLNASAGSELVNAGHNGMRRMGGAQRRGCGADGEDGREGYGD
jgi:hypothetical protein